MKTWQLKNDVVYGPFATRRKGMALGINILTREKKYCSFDCLYCQCGWTKNFDPTAEHKFLSLEEIEEGLRRSFSKIAFSREHVDSIVLSGNGEPTLHPDIKTVAGLLKELRDHFFPGVLIQCLSAGTELHRLDVQEALNLLERPTIKLDAALEGLFQKIDRPLKDFNLVILEEKLSSLKKFAIQTCFFGGKINNIFPEALEAWYAFLARVKPFEVEIYSLARQTAARKLEGLPYEKLEEIAQELFRRTGLVSLVV
jgi:wyosine [tRNA(Phe)-imidazoG37] synthetase (radical SAM superfamily)